MMDIPLYIAPNQSTKHIRLKPRLIYRDLQELRCLVSIREEEEVEWQVW